MNLILLFIQLIPRPDCPPIRAEDIQKALLLQKEYETMHYALSTPHSALCTTHYAPGRFVIGFQPNGLIEVISWIENFGGKVSGVHQDAGFVTADFPTDIPWQNLKQKTVTTPGIRFFEPDFLVSISRIPNDSFFLTKQWDKWVMYADRAWDITTGSGSVVKVAVVDNGVEYWHPDLAVNFRQGEIGYDFVGGDEDPKPDNPNIPEAFHGTHVAGIISAVSDNLIGVAGWAQVQILAVRALNDSGNGTLSDVALAIRWAVDHGARVINMSLGGSSSSTPLNEACQYAFNKGAVLVAASGNDGQPIITYPARLRECIAVGAMDELSGLAGFSNYGPEQEVVAPGVAIYSTAPSNSYKEAQGTSMACPEVAGVAALIIALNPALSPSQVRAIISASAIDMGMAGKDDWFGYGLVNAWRALELTQAFQPITIKNSFTPSLTTIISRKELSLPDGVASATGYDEAGRCVFVMDHLKSKILFPTVGTYFIALKERNGVFRLIKAVVLP